MIPSDSTVDSSFSMDDLITQLKVLQQLKPNERIASRGPLLRIEACTRTQAIRRWWVGECRSDNLRAIGRVIDHAIRHVNSGVTSPPSLRSDLRLAGEGIRNLLVTYHDDSVVCAQVLLLLQKCTDCVNDDGVKAATDMDVETQAIGESMANKKLRKRKIA